MEIALFSPLSHLSQLHIAHFLTLSCQVGSFLWPEDDHTWFSSCLLTHIPLGFTCTSYIIVDNFAPLIYHFYVKLFLKNKMQRLRPASETQILETLFIMEI